MSERCHKTAQKVIAMYQSGHLERKKTGNLSLAIHATYFDFLFNVNVRKQEEEVYKRLSDICVKHCRPERRQSKSEGKVKTNRDS